VKKQPLVVYLINTKNIDSAMLRLFTLPKLPYDFLERSLIPDGKIAYKWFTARLVGTFDD
jgi:hypothetical protein